MCCNAVPCTAGTAANHKQAGGTAHAHARDYLHSFHPCSIKLPQVVEHEKAASSPDVSHHTQLGQPQKWFTVFLPHLNCHRLSKMSSRLSWRVSERSILRPRMYFTCGQTMSDGDTDVHQHGRTCMRGLRSRMAGGSKARTPLEDGRPCHEAPRTTNIAGTPRAATSITKAHLRHANEDGRPCHESPGTTNTAGTPRAATSTTKARLRHADEDGRARHEAADLGVAQEVGDPTCQGHKGAESMVDWQKCLQR